MNVSIRPRRQGSIRRPIRRVDPGARLTVNPRPWYDLPTGHQSAGLR